MKIKFTQDAWKDFEWFLDKDKHMVKRIRELLKDILRNPEESIGKPERLMFQLAGSVLSIFKAIWMNMCSDSTAAHPVTSAKSSCVLRNR